MQSQAQTKPNANPLPEAATWEELSMKAETVGTDSLSQWIDESLGELEEKLNAFVTPRSLKKSLRGDR